MSREAQSEPSLDKGTSTMTEINHVIFDFGRVLGNFDKMTAAWSLATYSTFSAQEIHDAIVGNPSERALESGQISPEDFANTTLRTIGAEE